MSAAERLTGAGTAGGQPNDLPQRSRKEQAACPPRSGISPIPCSCRRFAIVIAGGDPAAAGNLLDFLQAGRRWRPAPARTVRERCAKSLRGSGRPIPGDEGQIQYRIRNSAQDKAITGVTLTDTLAGWLVVSGERSIERCALDGRDPDLRSSATLEAAQRDDSGGSSSLSARPLYRQSDGRSGREASRTKE